MCRSRAVEGLIWRDRSAGKAERLYAFDQLRFAYGSFVQKRASLFVEARRHLADHSTRLALFSFVFVLAVCAHPACATEAETLRFPPPQAKISASLDERVGRLSAGTLCLPNGLLHLRDFVEGDSDFATIASQSLWGFEQARVNRRGEVPSISIDLKSTTAKLCAKAWGAFGMGNTKSLSGDVSFVFDWSSTSSSGLRRSGSSTIAFRVPVKQALVPKMIFQEAVQRVTSEILAKSL